MAIQRDRHYQAPIVSTALPGNRRSAIDVAICLAEANYGDISNHENYEKASYETNPSSVSYGFDEFKREVIAWLTLNLGSGVKSGKRAKFALGDSGRRDADVLACVGHRRFISYQSLLSNSHHKGICFWTTDGTMIINFPKQHRDNCTTKRQGAQSRFKPNVRVLKNMRSAMVEAFGLAHFTLTMPSGVLQS